eukprot:TRINITY_DN5895_c0_g1_i6.p1 TRINITY_DN5895_c0_g1~~TRINITY_DN5895_c0_g1_i6.p1  ORF type:complete len:135 (+),score=21.31 TRINITY_DN5895_c0_g1_i6:192-596(+)
MFDQPEQLMTVMTLKKAMVFFVMMTTSTSSESILRYVRCRYRRLLATLVVAWSLGAALVFAQLCVTAANASVPDYWTVEYWWNCALHFLNFVVVAVVAVLLRPISNTRHPAFDESYDMIVLDETTRHALICRNL